MMTMTTARLMVYWLKTVCIAVTNSHFLYIKDKIDLEGNFTPCNKWEMMK